MADSAIKVQDYHDICWILKRTLQGQGKGMNLYRIDRTTGQKYRGT
jgi:hypothetical protein